VLREEMQKMRSAGIRQCIVESRPDYSAPLESRRLLDYAGPGWWEIVGTILDEAERLGMKIWLGDDVVFPSGCGAGRIRDHYPHLLKVFLAERPIDARGPLPGASFRVQGWLRSDEHALCQVSCAGERLHRIGSF